MKLAFLRKTALLFLGLLVLGFATVFLHRFQEEYYLWIFPLDANFFHFAYWCGLSFLYAAAGRGSFPFANQFKIVLSGVGICFFCAIQGVWWLGIVAFLLPFLLWFLLTSSIPRSTRLGIWATFTAFTIFFSHRSIVLEPSVMKLLEVGRFAISLLAAFYVYKIISFGVSVVLREERPSLQLTLEYFLAPPFWLSPNHAGVIPLSGFQKLGRDLSLKESARAWWWIFRGVLHAWAFLYTFRLSMPFITESYTRGIRITEWPALFFVGMVLFVISYLEKSRVDYIVAGIFRLAGFNIAPDFNSPFLARNFLDFWRRYHSWVLDFFLDVIYFPVVVLLRKIFWARFTVVLGIFITFFIGSSLSHFTMYLGSIGDCFILSALTALMVLSHYGVTQLYGVWQPKGAWGQRFKNTFSYLGIPLTWVTVSYLWFLDYAVFGMGWSLEKIWSVVQ